MKQTTIFAYLAGTAAAVTTTLPASAGESSVPTAIPVSGDFDGGMTRFERERKILPLCLFSATPFRKDSLSKLTIFARY